MQTPRRIETIFGFRLFPSFIRRSRNAKSVVTIYRWKCLPASRQREKRHLQMLQHNHSQRTMMTTATRMKGPHAWRYSPSSILSTFTGRTMSEYSPSQPIIEPTIVVRPRQMTRIYNYNNNAVYHQLVIRESQTHWLDGRVRMGDDDDDVEDVESTQAGTILTKLQWIGNWSVSRMCAVLVCSHRCHRASVLHSKREPFVNIRMQ